MCAAGIGCTIAALALIVYVVFTAKPIHPLGGYTQPREPENPVPPSRRGAYAPGLNYRYWEKHGRSAPDFKEEKKCE